MNAMVFLPLFAECTGFNTAIMTIMVSEKVLRIGFVDDHPLLLAQLEMVINEIDDMSVVATAESVSEAK